MSIKIQAQTDDDARTWKYYKKVDQEKTVRIKENEFNELALDRSKDENGKFKVEVCPPLYITYE